MYFIENYLIASGSELERPKIFSISTYRSVGSFGFNCNITSGVYLKTKGVFVFGTSKGEVLYFNIASLPNIVAANVLMNQSTYQSAHVDRSSKEEYVSVSFA
jgi:hypothetical protein